MSPTSLRTKRRRKRIFGRILAVILAIPLLFLLLLLLANGIVLAGSCTDIISEEKAAGDGNASYDCILVLGCGVREDGTPSPMLRHRLDTAIALYKEGAAPKILMSGDHGTLYYNEVQVMKSYAIDAGVPSEDIFMDHAGFSTYDSIYRAQYIFGAKRPLIVTQRYHLYRAVFLAKAFGMKADGVDAGMSFTSGQIYREVRELAARAKDLLYAVLKPLPACLGDPIPITGNGDLTND